MVARRAVRHAKPAEGRAARPQRKPVGQIAVEMGLVKASQVREALRLQKAEDTAKRPHRLLGIILLDAGYISNEELIQILRYYQTVKKQKLLSVIKKAHTPDLGETVQPL